MKIIRCKFPRAHSRTCTVVQCPNHASYTHVHITKKKWLTFRRKNCSKVGLNSVRTASLALDLVFKNDTLIHLFFYWHAFSWTGKISFLYVRSVSDEIFHESDVPNYLARNLQRRDSTFWRHVDVRIEANQHAHGVEMTTIWTELEFGRPIIFFFSSSSRNSTDI